MRERKRVRDEYPDEADDRGNDEDGADDQTRNDRNVEDGPLPPLVAGHEAIRDRRKRAE